MWLATTLYLGVARKRSRRSDVGRPASSPPSTGSTPVAAHEPDRDRQVGIGLDQLAQHHLAAVAGCSRCSSISDRLSLPSPSTWPEIETPARHVVVSGTGNRGSPSARARNVEGVIDDPLIRLQCRVSNGISNPPATLTPAGPVPRRAALVPALECGRVRKRRGGRVSGPVARMIGLGREQPGRARVRSPRTEGSDAPIRCRTGPRRARRDIRRPAPASMNVRRSRFCGEEVDGRDARSRMTARPRPAPPSGAQPRNASRPPRDRRRTRSRPPR